MIQSKLGEVKITQPIYELCKILNCNKEDVDRVVKAGLVADLASILGALSNRYGTENAMEMWTRCAELYIESMKGETP